MSELLVTIRKGADFEGCMAAVARYENLTILKLDNGDELWFDTDELRGVTECEGAARLPTPARTEPLPDALPRDEVPDVLFFDQVGARRRRRRR